VELDDLSFDKVIKKFDAVLVKFDVAYPYGEKHEAFAKFAEHLTVHIDDFLVATVGVKDYGERENSKLADRFNVGNEYPVIKLFRDGNFDKWVDYPKDHPVTLENLRLFVREHSSVYMVLKGCLEQFDYVAKRFVDAVAATSAVAQEAQAILNEAEEQQKQVAEKDQDIAKIYIVMMKRIQDKGLDFVAAEKKRQKQLLNGKISEKKKLDIQQKLNILSAFDSISNRESHAEL